MYKLILSSLLLSSTAWAIVSIKPVEISGQEASSHEVGVSYSTKSGNSDTTSTSLSLKGVYQNINSANMIVIDYDYAEANGVKNSDKTFAHIRHIRSTDIKYLNYEIFTQAQKDDFRSIESRVLIGAGARYKYTLSNDSNLFLGIGLFNTQLDENNIKSDFESLNSYISYNQTFDSGAKLTYNGYYQPRVDEVSDYHISQKAQISLKITDKVELVVSMNHTYDSKPAIGVEKSDLSTKTGINYKF